MSMIACCFVYRNVATYSLFDIGLSAFYIWPLCCHSWIRISVYAAVQVSLESRTRLNSQ